MSPPALYHHTLHHARHARREVAKALSHLAPAMVLLLGALATLTGREPFTAVAALEFGIGAAYLVLLVKELRHLRAPHAAPTVSQGIAWLEVAAAGILALEGYHLWHRHHVAEMTGAHPPRTHVLPWLYALLALVYLTLAVSMKQLSRRRFLAADDAGFRVRLRPFGRRTAFRWAELTELHAIGSAAVRVRAATGAERLLSFAHLHHGAKHRDHLLALAQAAGVTVKQAAS